MSTYILGMDVGTSSVKASLWDVEKERVVSQFTDNYPISFDIYGRIRQDPEAIYQVVLQLLENIIDDLEAKTENNRRKFITVVLDTALHTLLLLDEQMNPMSDVIPWMDARADSVALEILKSEQNAEIHERTGCPVDSVYPLYKIIWFARNNADLLKQSGKISSIKDYLLYKFTGLFVLDFSTASGSGCLDIRKRCWAEDLLWDLARVDLSKFPTLISPYEVLEPSGEIKRFFEGRNVYVNFAVGVSDAAASSIGTTCFNPNTLTISMGTSAAIRKISPEPLKKANVLDKGIWCYIVDEKSYIIGMAMRSGGCVMDWWVKNFLKSDDYNEIVRVLGDMTYYDSSPIRTTRPIFIPTIYGERVPRWIPNRNGALLGLSGATSIDEATQSVIEGIGFNFRRIFEAVETYFGRGEAASYNVVATGGMCQIQNWLQFLSNLFNRSMIIRESRFDTSLGLIMFYLKEKAPVIFELMSAKKDVISPKKNLSGLLENLYLKWLNEIESMEERLCKINDIT